MNGRYTVTAMLLVLGACTLGGCASRGGILSVDRHASVPVGAIPEPAGAKVGRWQTVQVASAIADQTVLYRADFVGTSTVLSPAASERLSRHAQTGLGNTLPWIVEPSGNADLDSARVASVINELSRRGITPIDVQLATPAALGITGPQAERGASGVDGNRGVGSGLGALVPRSLALSGFTMGLGSGTELTR